MIHQVLSFKRHGSRWNRDWKSKFRRGDTLIEVIFAFAILGTIIGFAYGGAISAHKSAVAAQQRTQALELVQYQTAALNAYRASLPWDSSQGEQPSFLNGNPPGQNSTPSGPDLPDLTLPNSNQAFYCLYPIESPDKNNPNKQWRMISNFSSQSDQQNCWKIGTNSSGTSFYDQNTICVEVLFSSLAGRLSNSSTAVTPNPSTPQQCPAAQSSIASPVSSTTETLQADIIAYWTDPFGNQQSVKNIVILTKQR